MKSVGETVYHLALSAAGGDIVEVGSALGTSTINLVLGAREGNGCPVYSVDYHEPTKSWTGDTMYGPQDREIFIRNILAAGMAKEVRMVDLPAERAVMAWGQTISFLFFDPGLFIRGWVEIMLDAWLRRVIPGGIVAVNDTLNDDLGAAIYLRHRAVQNVYRDGYVWVAEKTDV